MLKKISVIRMVPTRLLPAKDRPASPARNAGHSTNGIDDSRIADRLEDRKVAGAVAVHVALAQVKALLRRQLFRDHSLAVSLRIWIDHVAGIDQAAPVEPPGRNLLNLEERRQRFNQEVG